MFATYFRKLGTPLNAKGRRTAARRRRNGNKPLLTHLETRDLPAALTWAVGTYLPIAEGGIAAAPSGANVLVLGGPSNVSYTVTASDPTWKAAIGPTVQPLDFARSSPAVGTLPNGYYLVFGGTQNGFATAAVTQYDPNTVTITDGATNQTRSLRSMNTPRTLLGGATDTGTGQSYAIGGQNNNGTPLATVEMYNPTANTWTYEAPLPQALYSESAVADGAGHIFTFGGVAPTGRSPPPFIGTLSRPTPGTKSPRCRPACGPRPRCSPRTARSTSWAARRPRGRPLRWKATTSPPTPGHSNAAAGAGQRGRRGRRLARPDRGARRLRPERQPNGRNFHQSKADPGGFGPRHHLGSRRRRRR